MHSDRGGRRSVQTILLVPSVASVVEVPGGGTSWTVTALVGVGTIVVILVLGSFLTGERYLQPPKPERGVGFVEDRLVAEELLSSLAPMVVLLAEKERSVADSLENETLDREARSVVEELCREAAASGFWGRFVAVSALVEDDPARACEELHLLLPLTRAALEELSRAGEIVVGGAGARTHLSERGESDGRE